MFVVTRNGFVSVVKEKGEPTKMRIRSQNMEAFEGFINPDLIVKNPNGVFAFYAVVDHTAAVAFMTFLAENVDYESFSGAAESENVKKLIQVSEAVSVAFRLKGI